MTTQRSVKASQHEEMGVYSDYSFKMCKSFVSHFDTKTPPVLLHNTPEGESLDTKMELLRTDTVTETFGSP